MLQSSSSGKNGKTSLIFLDPICTEKGSLWATPKMQKNFFGRNIKSRSSAFRKFLFYQNIICFDWVMNLFLSWVMFSGKKVSFPAKTAKIALFLISHRLKKYKNLHPWSFTYEWSENVVGKCWKLPIFEGVSIASFYQLYLSEMKIVYMFNNSVLYSSTFYSLFLPFFVLEI